MEQTIEAVYEGGVLRPLTPLPLAEHQRVAVTIRSLPEPTAEPQRPRPGPRERWEREADDTISLEAVRQALAKIPGALTDDFTAERDDR